MNKSTAVQYFSTQEAILDGLSANRKFGGARTRYFRVAGDTPAKGLLQDRRK